MLKYFQSNILYTTYMYKSAYYKLDNAHNMKKFGTEILVMPKNTSSHYFT